MTQQKFAKKTDMSHDTAMIATATLQGQGLNWAVTKCLIKGLSHKDFYELAEKTDARWYQQCCEGDETRENMLNFLASSHIRDFCNEWDLCEPIFIGSNIRTRQKAGHPAEAEIGSHIPNLGIFIDSGRNVRAYGKNQIEAGLRCLCMASLGDLIQTPVFQEPDYQRPREHQRL